MSDRSLRLTRRGWTLVALLWLAGVLLLGWGLGSLADALVDPTPVLPEETL